MKQPNINIFGEKHKVMQIEFDTEGRIGKIVYQLSKNNNRTVFRNDTMINDSLTSHRKIQKPTPHPFHDYAYAPDLEKLLC